MGALLVDVVVGIDVVAVVCVCLCGFALWWAGFFFAFVVVVGVVGVVNALGAVLELDDDAPQPAAISASEARPAHMVGSRLICILDKA